jgi:Fe2+ transport system protein B
MVKVLDLKCYGLIAKLDKCADSTVTRGAEMDVSNYISMAYDYAAWFSGTVIGTVSGSIAGGWMAVAAFAGVIVVMFLVTSLMSPRRD